MKNSFKNIFLVGGIFLISLQTIAQDTTDRIHFGLIGGMHMTFGSFSDLNKDNFDDPKSTTGLMGGVFAEFEFGKDRNFSIRPEIAFLSRGTKIENIKANLVDMWSNNVVANGTVDYELKAQYTDIRVPIIYNFGSPNGIRPYIYLAPVLGLVRGGDISLKGIGQEYSIDVSDANMASTYVAGQIGLGVKFPIAIGTNNMHIGVEANYELGLTDTYGSKEKDGKAKAICLYNRYNITGTRKFSGIEIAANVSIPLSLFTSKKSEEKPVYVEQSERQPRYEAPEKPCYTLDEIMNLIARGKSVKGKTLCAINEINFAYNKSTLSRSSYAYLDKIAKFMKETNARVEVRGHTDSKGTDDYNMKLSKERAEAVYDYLLSKGVSKRKLSYSYYGESRPIATNDTEAGRKQNRRVEFVID